MINKKLDKPFWRKDTFVEYLFNIFGSDNIKIVGGAVRNAIRKKVTNDLDLAVNINPEKVKEILKKNKVKFYDVSKGHGTISLISKLNKIEITCLRKDIKTYGRRAKVKFTTSFELDSERRDFTINAIYSNFEGDIYDPHDGYKDLKKNIIKFIGIPEKRIIEDRLRLLRYFRMLGLYSSKKEHIDSKSLNASIKNFSNIKTLAKERINIEFFKLIISDNAAFSLTLLKKNNLLDYLIEGFQGISITNLKKLSKLPQEKFTRISFLITTSKIYIGNLQKQLKLSKADIKLLKSTCVYNKIIKSEKEVKSNKYFYGKDITYIRYLVTSCINENELDKTFLNIINEWAVPKLPVNGNDIIKTKEIKKINIGKTIRALEEWWVKENFKPNKIECLKKLKDFY
jgi:poly(A) polymerase